MRKELADTLRTLMLYLSQDATNPAIGEYALKDCCCTRCRGAHLVREIAEELEIAGENHLTPEEAYRQVNDVW